MSWNDVASAAQLSSEAPLSVDLDGLALVVVRCGEQIYAVDDVCTHDGERLDGATVEDCEIICPRHGARFCLRTGAALTPPAYEPLRTYPVRIESGRVLIQQPD